MCLKLRVRRHHNEGAVWLIQNSIDHRPDRRPSLFIRHHPAKRVSKPRLVDLYLREGRQTVAYTHQGLAVEPQRPSILTVEPYDEARGSVLGRLPHQAEKRCS